jgi:uncharacterized protein YbbC (DUF1343 family)
MHTTTRRNVLAAAAAVASGTGVAASSVVAEPAEAGNGTSGRRLRTGAEVAAASGWRILRGSKTGIFSNPTGILRDTRHIVDDLAAVEGLTIVAAFGPEHGFRGSAQAGGSEGDTVDPRTQIPVYDAYGANTAKLGQLFTKAGLETVVFDIQDIGARFYTYIWTLYRAMAAAAPLGLKFVVLDRPNPIGGAADGAMMTPGFTSGVGLKEIVQQHGMTVGELARFYNGEFLPAEVGSQVELEVVRVEGWRPDQRAQDLGLPFVPPSPNIPTADSAAVYAGTCWFEGTNLSEGRGTTRPFELIGAPYLDYRWGDRLNARGLPGVEFREAYFVPTFNKYVNETCAGVQLHISDLHRFQPVPTAAAMLIEAKRYEQFQWRYDTYDPQRPYWIDKLSGSPRLRTMIDAGADLDEVVGAWEDEVSAFERQRRPYLLYRR